MDEQAEMFPEENAFEPEYRELPLFGGIAPEAVHEPFRAVQVNRQTRFPGIPAVDWAAVRQSLREKRNLSR